MIGALIGIAVLFGAAPATSSQSSGCPTTDDTSTTDPAGGGQGTVDAPTGEALTFRTPAGTTFTLPEAGQPVQQAAGGATSGPIPTDFLAAYQQVGKATGIAWTLLAGIGWEETRHGANTNTSSAGAQGPMQFMPATFAAYGVDGNGDGTADARQYQDAIASAANYLLANSVTADPAGLESAVFNYNHATWYYNDVLTWANQYATGTVTTAPSRSGDTAERAATTLTTAITGAQSGQAGPATVAPVALPDSADEACDAALLASQDGGQVVVGGSSTSGTGTVDVQVSGNSVTIPDHPDVLASWRGTTVTFGDARIARGVANAMTWLGLSYSWGGGHSSNGTHPTKGTSSGCYGGCVTFGDVNITGWDCSGLMLNIAWGWGISIPGSSGPQVSGAPVKVPLSQAKPGDLVGWRGHVAMYLGTDGGNVVVLEAPSSGQRVHIGINNPGTPQAARWWQKPAVRPLPPFQSGA